MKRMPEPTWEGKVKLSDGYERQVCQFGNGSNVLIGLHGGPGASLQSLLPLGRMADDDLRIVIYDQIEGGGSDRPGRDDLLTVEGFAHEFDDLVTTMDLGKVHVLGHSWGGMLALECALRSPHLVKSLVLCGTLASTKTAIAGYEELIAGASDAGRAAVAAGKVDLNDDSPEAQALLEILATHSRRSRPFEIERSCREFKEIVLPIYEEIGRAYYVMWGDNDFVPTGPLRDWDVSDRLEEISVPALVVCGRYDEVAPLCSQEIAEGIPDAQWLILGQSSHMHFHEAERDIVLAAIRAFVS